MSRSTLSAALRIPSTLRPGVPVVTLRKIATSHRELLVDTARRHLGCLGGDAEDLVQDVLLAALQGAFPVSRDASRAVSDVLREVVALANHIADGGAP